MPERGWWVVTVPGAPRAWADLHERFGRLRFEEIFEPAVGYAEHGFPVSPITAGYWQSAAESTYKPFEHDPSFKPWFQTFAPGGCAPQAGETWCSPDHARTLRRIATSNSRDFYSGELAQAIERFAVATGGPLRAADLAAHTGTWVEPITTSYREHEVWEIPPNGQGIAALVGLNILSGFDLAQHPRDSVEAYHLQIEAMKLAFSDARRYVADPEHAEVPIAGLLDAGYAAERRALIAERRANRHAWQSAARRHRLRLRGRRRRDDG